MTATLGSRKVLAVVAASVAAAIGVSACSSAAGAKTINLVAYSVPKPAYDALGAAFAKTSAGKGVTFQSSYGPSGTQASNVIAGQKADYVAFSTGADMSKVADAGKVASNWDSGPTKGLVSDSVVVITVRKGNPLGIHSWADLIKPGVKIVTPDPATSGSAKWNLLAAYEQVIAQGGTPAQAQAYLKAFFKNVVLKASSGSDAMTSFLNGTGDVLISYEDEAIYARQQGKPVDYIIPDQTMLIENPAAVTKGAPKIANDFLSFVESTQGQEIFASQGFRPVLSGVNVGTVQGANDPSNPFPTPAKLITVESLGGWSKVNDEFFGDSGVVTKIEAAS
jgi:sulfate/thiosulfate transport system substrate-binding protein